MNNILLKSQLYTIAGIVIFAIFVLAIMLFSAFDKSRQLNQSLIILEGANADMLMLRRNEKDFLTRNQLKYQQKFQTNEDKLISKIKHDIPGMHDLIVKDNHAISLNPYLQLDFGAIAKGLAVTFIISISLRCLSGI